MRVATNAYSDAMLNQFNSLTAQQNNLQTQAATGLRVRSAEDDPTAMRDTLSYLAKNTQQQQYSANIANLQTRANTINGVLQSLQKVSSRAGEIALTAASPANTAPDLNIYASEVNNLIQQVVTEANTKDPVSGQYLFGGTASTTPPYTTTLDAAGNVTAVTYNGNSTVNQAQIGDGVTTAVDIPGENSSGSGARGLIADTASGADFLNHLISLRNDLVAGNTAGLTGADNTNLQKDENNIAYQVANNGVVQNKLTAASALATSNSNSLNQMTSNASSANLVNTMVQLNNTQTAYQAALQSGAKIMQLSILNYLH